MHTAMKYSIIVILLLSFFALRTPSNAHIASFFGDSFIFQSLDNTHQDTTTISLRFMTSSPDGILFLALGYSQSISIELVNSRLEVKVDLGYGEETISTAEDETLNNLIWHEFKVIRSGSNIKIVLNRADVASSQIPVPSSERAKLSLDFGVFLGGLGGNVSLLEGSRPSKFFRGCMLEAEINGNDLLSSLTTAQNRKIVYNVLTGCPRIFRVSHSEPMTFDSPSAYIALKRWTTQDEGTFECMVKTNGRSGSILYNAGFGRGEFIGLEMVEGVISASVNKGGGVVSLHTTKPINDGSWHSVRFGFRPSYLDIRVDGKRTKAFIEQTAPEFEGVAVSVQQRNLDLTGHLYIGGIPDSLSRRNAIPHGLISLGISEGRGTIGHAFPGCMKNLRINHRRKGLSDFLISSKISAGCNAIRRFPKDGTRVESGFQEANDAISRLFAVYTSKKAQSPNPLTTKVTTTTLPATTTPKFLIPVPHVMINPLSVLEGGLAELTKQEVSLSITGMERGDMEKDILFVLSAPMAHGFLTKSNGCDGSYTIFEFTAEDITSKSVCYCHDGSENFNDGFNFTVAWNLANKNARDRRDIISLFAGKAEFISTGIALNHGKTCRLPISVTAVDDSPELHIPTDYLYHPVKNVATHLPTAVLNATDADSSAEEILYTILGNGGDGEFHMENEGVSWPSITEFTQAHVDRSAIVFIHNGNRNNTRLLFRVSNPNAESLASGQPHTNVLRVAAVALNISVFAKEITLLEKSAFIFTKEYLIVTSNAEPGVVGFICKVKKKPSLGVIEVMHSDGAWNETSSFGVDQVNNGFVRYRNTKRTLSKRNVDNDSFVFTVSGADVEFERQTFPIKIKIIDVEFSVVDVLLKNGLQEKMIAVNNLQVNVTHIVVTNCRIQVLLQKSLRHVEIFFNDIGVVLDSDDAFTMKEAQTGRVSLRVKQKYASQPFQEMVPLVAVVNDLYQSAVAWLNVTYVPDLDRILLVNKGLELDEGQQQIISVTLLKASLPSSSVNDKIKLFHFNVTRSPVHGVLKFVEEETLADVIKGENSIVLTGFISTDLERGKLYYQHDDSETTFDCFSIDVTPIVEGQLPQTVAKLSAVSLEANFTIKIRLVNDQRPERTVDRLFEIARNGERLLTKDDLWYHDADSNYNDLDLMISSRGMTNGDILNATSRRHERITQFTQRQILNGEVLIKHRGRDFGRFVFWVRDGKHYATGLFAMSASDPFLKVVNASRLSVTKGSEAIITTTNLWCKTNVKGLKKDIIYQVTTVPENGLLYLNTSAALDDDGNPQAVSTFTQEDIVDGHLVYKNSGSPIMDDAFIFRVSAGAISKSGNLTVGVYLESYSKPPLVQKNRTLVVAQGERIQIRKQDLRVVHPDTKANDIAFFVTEYPSMGSLEFATDMDSEEFNSEPVTEFTQSDINRGLVWYIQNDSFTYSDNGFIDGLLLDYFKFNVTNHILSVIDLSFFFDIVPKEIPLRLGNFSVREGRTKTIVQKYLHIEGPHFDDNEIEIRVVSPPIHGILESQIGVALKSFNYRVAVAEFLYYAHNGSDFLHDNFSLQALTLHGKKESHVVTAFVTVIPENDERPIAVNNTGLNVWMNSVTELSPSAIAFIDSDTEPKDINFRILPPSNGWVALKDDPSTSIHNFSQTQLNDGDIVFVHKGPTTGGFTFQVDDGVNYASKSIFVVTARLLIITVKSTGNMKGFPGHSTPLSMNTLRSTTNDFENPNRTVTYVVTDGPKLGKLIKMHKSSMVESLILIFTQKDIDNGLVLYQQETDIAKWSDIDSFVLTATSLPAENITDIKIMVNITYDAPEAVGKQSPVQVNKGYTVTEGGRFLINTTILDASNLFKKLPLRRDRKHYELIYTLVKVPLHGNLSVAGRNVTEANTTFTQTQLLSRKIAYMHDNSDTLKDTFDFNVYLTDKRFSTSNGKPWIVPGTFFQDTFNIIIIALNDNPPKLLTKGKIFTVVDGFETLILSDTLKAVDPDSNPDEISYSIIRPPSRGKIVFITDRTTMITEFTQNDVDHRKVSFLPHLNNMTQSELSDAFYYGLTDGIQRSSYNFLQIKIVPVRLQVSPQVIEISQTSYSAHVSTPALNVSTNGNYSLITFEVLKPAKTGTILVNEEKSSVFTYRQLSMKNVEFAMTDNSLTNDSFYIQVNYERTVGANISTSAQVQIIMKPLILQGSLQASYNGLSRIGLSVLNASALFDKTNSMPIFEVFRRPSYAEILKPILPKDSGRSKREIGDHLNLLTEVDNFSHEDVSLGHVFLYIENVNITRNGTLPDNIGLRLTVVDGSVQPADFILNYDILEVEADDFSSFFEDYMPSVEGAEETTFPDVQMAEEKYSTSVPVTSYEVVLESQPPSEPVNEFNNIEVLDAVEPKDLVSDPKPAEPGVSWLIPVAVVIAVIIVLAIALIVVLTKRKQWFRGGKYGDQAKRNEENRSLTTQENVKEKTSSDNFTPIRRENPVSSESLRSPACPGVTVTLLKNEPRSGFSESLQPSVFGGEERHSFSIVGSAMASHSYRDDPSTAYAPSTVYHYDDVGSVDYPDAPEVEFYAANQGSYPGEMLFHARSAKLIDPDVLALYSSDESIPSMIDEKYAIPISGVTGSVPSGLHRTNSQPGTSHAGIASSRSTASLSKVPLSPELSLLPNSGLESNQYWI